MIILLDLENTLITEFHMPLFLDERMKAIASLIKEHPDSKIGLLSWAIDNERDMKFFNRQLKHHIEESLGVSFDTEWTLDLEDWSKEMLKFGKKLLSKEDLFDIFDKDTFLFKLCKSHPIFKNEDVMLIDDAFPSSSTRFENSSLTIVNVLTLERERR